MHPVVIVVTSTCIQVARAEDIIETTSPIANLSCGRVLQVFVSHHLLKPPKFSIYIIEPTSLISNWSIYIIEVISPIAN